MPFQSNRRTFLKQAGLSIAAAGFAPSLLQAKQSGSPIIIGSDDWQFEVTHDWGTLPEHLRWRNTHGVSIGKDGTVYISHQGDENNPVDTVVAFDPSGNYLRSFGKEFAGGMHGIDIREEDGTEYLYLSVTAPIRVAVKTDTKGEIIWKQPAPVKAHIYDDRAQYSPTNICFGKDNTLYVGDGYGSHYLHHYDKDGNWLKSFGGIGELPGQFRTPHGQWLDTRDPANHKIVVADRANSRLQFVDLDGKPLFIVQGVPEDKKNLHGKKDELKNEDGTVTPVTYAYGISYPSAIDLRGENLLIADLHARVTILNGQNEIVANLGFDEPWTAEVLDGRPFSMRAGDTFKDGKFVHPHDSAFDANGNIFVTEWVEKGRISYLKRI